MDGVPGQHRIREASGSAVEKASPSCTPQDVQVVVHDALTGQVQFVAIAAY